MSPLRGDEIAEALRSLPGWTGDEHGLKRSLTFTDFRGAMRFMQSCIEGIEQQNHHPVWTNKYNRVDIHLDTFDIGHLVTTRDVKLARYFETVLREQGQQFGYVEPG